MRTIHDELRGNISHFIVEQFYDDSMSYEENMHSAKSATDRVLEDLWGFLEDYKIDFNGRLILEYGMIKHLIKGPDA